MKRYAFNFTPNFTISVVYMYEQLLALLTDLAQKWLKLIHCFMKSQSQFIKIRRLRRRNNLIIYATHLKLKLGYSPHSCKQRKMNSEIEMVGEIQQDHTSLDRRTLDEIQRGWLLNPETELSRNKGKQAFKWTVGLVILAVLAIGMLIIITKSLPQHHPRSRQPDNYTTALREALLFFNEQKSGRLPKENYNISWRADSGLHDGNETKRGLVGGYYDAGDNTKYHFPMAFAMTMLSWSVIEYEGKYKAIEEYEHVRELIKWGIDYLLLTFDSSAASVPYIYSQVGGSRNGSTVPDDHTCWTRPEDMDYPRLVQKAYTAPELAGEMAAALAAAAIVFRDNTAYSEMLIKGAATVFEFSLDKSRHTYSFQNPMISSYYKSSSYYDEHMWGGAWLYYATGNRSFLSLVTNPRLLSKTKSFSSDPDLRVLSWDNKLPAAMMLLTRLRIFLDPGYPYEAVLRSYHKRTGLTMCSYLRRYSVYNWTQGGLIQLSHGQGKPLQYVANAAFLASLFADYLNAAGAPGWYCGPDLILADDLRSFAASQINYILGANPMNMSYVVGYGFNYPKFVHHRGASVPNNNRTYSCKGGWKWFQSRFPNPNKIAGAMVGGPHSSDDYKDVRSDHSHTEPTVAGNAGLVAALVSLTRSSSHGIEKNIIFSAVPPLYSPSPPPPSPWKP